MENHIADEIPRLVNAIVRDLESQTIGPPQFKVDLPKEDDNEQIVIDLDAEIKISPKLNVDIIINIIDRKYIFDPKNYFQDSYYRIIYVPDFSIQLKINIDVININFAYLNYIMSLAQLLTLDLIRSDQFEAIINAVVGALNMRMAYSYRYKGFFFQRKLNGRVVQQVSMILTSEEFDYRYTSFVSSSRLSVKYASERAIGIGNLGDFGKSVLK